VAWPLDERFRTADNRAIVTFIERMNPSAHDDIASILISSAKDLPDVRWYCPDTARYAYVVLHTPRSRIFGIAFGMDALAFRLPRLLHPDALAADGTVYAEIDDEWIQWRRTTMLDTKRWCKGAHDYAVGGETAWPE
jgi:hypothetical protein